MRIILMIVAIETHSQQGRVCQSAAVTGVIVKRHKCADRVIGRGVSVWSPPLSVPVSVPRQ